jgi:hypothetical protein
MFVKENFWVGAKGGLIEEKHYLCMRESVWLFLFLLLKQTGVSENGEGIVDFGHSMTREEISKATGFLESRIKRWIDRLRRTGYVRTEADAKGGLVFFVLAAKNKHKSTRRPGAQMHRQEASPGASVHPRRINAPSQPIEDKRISLVGGSPTTKSLSSYNKDAAANPAAIIKRLSKQKQIPKPRSWEDQKAELRLRGLLA